MISARLALSSGSPFTYSTLLHSAEATPVIYRAVKPLGANHLIRTPYHSLERLIRDLVAQKDYPRVEAVIDQLCNDFAYAVHHPHARNGGLIGLAAAAIALGPVRLRPR